MTEHVRTTVTTAAGPFSVIARLDDRPVVVASGWTGDVDGLLTVLPAHRRPQVRPVDAVEGVTDAVTAYHEGDLSAVDGIAVDQDGGVFLQQAWDLLRLVPPGSPISYTELAMKSGRPAAVRAAASACARNATALFVPCHRVVRSDGSLGGFRWGLDVKRWLLAHESVAAAGG